MTCLKGKMLENSGGLGIPYGWTETSKSFVCDAKTPLLPLKEYIKQTGAKGVAKHGNFQSEAPNKLTPPDGLRFVPDSTAVGEFLAHVPDMQQLSIAWRVTVTKNSNVVSPVGVVVCTQKEIIMPAAGHLALS